MAGAALCEPTSHAHVHLSTVSPAYLPTHSPGWVFTSPLPWVFWGLLHCPITFLIDLFSSSSIYKFHLIHYHSFVRLLLFSLTVFINLFFHQFVYPVVPSFNLFTPSHQSNHSTNPSHIHPLMCFLKDLLIHSIIRQLRNYSLNQIRSLSQTILQSITHLIIYGATCEARTGKSVSQ